MTRKDYEAIAAAISAARFTAGANSACDILTSALADVCERDNPRFDRARFLAACQADGCGVAE